MKNLIKSFLFLLVATFLIASPANAKKFKLGMAVGGHPCCEWMKLQGDVARAIAEKKDGII